MTTDEERRDFFDKARRELRPYTYPSITPILGVLSPDEGEVVGTGIFVRARGVPLVVTAAHVATRIHHYRALALPGAPGSRPQPISRPFALLPHPWDVAVTEVEAGS